MFSVSPYTAHIWFTHFNFWYIGNAELVDDFLKLLNIFNLFNKPFQVISNPVLIFFPPLFEVFGQASFVKFFSIYWNCTAAVFSSHVSNLSPLAFGYYVLFSFFFCSSFYFLQHVTAGGCKNMTKCPRKISEIEAVMVGAPWPIDKTSIYLENGREQV